MNLKLLKIKWWDYDAENLVKMLLLLCDSNLEKVRMELRQILNRNQIKKAVNFFN